MAAKKKAAKDSESAKYGAMAKELDQILAGIEEGEVDVDDLSDRVERATEMIRLCREKLDATQIRVQKVVSTLEDEEDEEEEEQEEQEEAEEEEGA